MKKIVLMMLLSMLTVTMGFAQESAFTEAVSRYKSAKTASATAVMVKHNKAMTKNKSYDGALYMKDPNKVAITANNGKEQLVMNGNTFTMVMGGHKHVASAKTASQFAGFQSRAAERALRRQDQHLQHTRSESNATEWQRGGYDDTSAGQTADVHFICTGNQQAHRCTGNSEASTAVVDIHNITSPTSDSEHQSTIRYSILNNKEQSVIDTE